MYPLHHAYSVDHVDVSRVSLKKKTAVTPKDNRR